MVLIVQDRSWEYSRHLIACLYFSKDCYFSSSMSAYSVMHNRSQERAFPNALLFRKKLSSSMLESPEHDTFLVNEIPYFAFAVSTQS